MPPENHDHHDQSSLQLSADHPRMQFGPLKDEPIDTRRMRTLRLLGSDDHLLTIDDVLVHGQYGKLHVDTRSVARVEILGTTSKAPRFWRFRKLFGARHERAVLHHTGILYHLESPAMFHAASADGEYDQTPVAINQLVSAGNAVGPPRIRFSPRNSTTRLLALVLRLMSFEDFLYEEAVRAKHRIRHMPVKFDHPERLGDILRLAVQYSHANAYSVEYKWITGPNCHAWTRHVIDPVIGYSGPLTGVGPLDIPTFLKVRGIRDPQLNALEDFEVNRKDPIYKRIKRNNQQRENSPGHAWARTYRPPAVTGLKATRAANLLAILTAGKYNPNREATRRLRDSYKP